MFPRKPKVQSSWASKSSWANKSNAKSSWANKSNQKTNPYWIIDENRVVDIGLRYLTRFPSSEKAFRLFLARKIKEYQKLADRMEQINQQDDHNVVKKITEIADTDIPDVDITDTDIPDVDITDTDIPDVDITDTDIDLSPEDESQSNIQKYIESAVQKAYRLGALNDQVFALNLLKSFRNQGLSSHQIKQKMKMKGLSEDQIETSYTDLQEIRAERDLVEVDEQLYTALRYAQKKRYLPFKEDCSTEERQKQLAAMARRGFSYEIAKKALDYDIQEALDLIEQGKI
jgi:regulatory protein